MLQFRLIGTAPEERTVGAESVINVQLKRVAASLDAVVVTALGQTTVAARARHGAADGRRAADIARTQRENFVNALQGRVAGVDVTSTSGVAGRLDRRSPFAASARSEQQPAADDRRRSADRQQDHEHRQTLASDAPTSALAFSNRGVDFTNRAADINPEDIESLTVLKGPEASALYGIDAANGAIVITTKRGQRGVGRVRLQQQLPLRARCARSRTVQDTYGPTTLSVGPATDRSCTSAPRIPPDTQIYDNIGGFFQTGVTQKHNLSFSGGARTTG